MTSIVQSAFATALLAMVALTSPAQALPGAGLRVSSETDIVHQVRSRHRHHHHRVYQHHGRHVSIYRTYRAPYAYASPYYASPYAVAPAIGSYFGGGGHHGHHRQHHHGHH